MWSSIEWARSEDASSLVHYERNVDNLAIEVVGQNWSSEVVSFPGGLGRRACDLAMDLLCQDMRDACKQSSEFAGSPTFTVFGLLGRKEEVF